MQVLEKMLKSVRRMFKRESKAKHGNDDVQVPAAEPQPETRVPDRRRKYFGMPQQPADQRDDD